MFCLKLPCMTGEVYEEKLEMGFEGIAESEFHGGFETQRASV